MVLTMANRNEGEGSRTAARRYNEAARKTARRRRQPDPSPRSDEERRAMEQAEEEGARAPRSTIRRCNATIPGRPSDRAAAVRHGGALRMPNPLLALRSFGQSPWLDHLDRGLIRSGELERMINRWQLGGLTSNPTIFAAALAGGGDYDEEIARLARRSAPAKEIYERLLVGDIAAAADLFAPAQARSGGIEGWVCVEVSPHLADDAQATVAEAERLRAAADRANVMIKVPGTAAGVAATGELISRGVSVNVTLLFSLERYRGAADAYLDGMERATAAAADLGAIASVASCFSSRIDAAIDARLELLIAEQGSQALAARSL
jgi:transaldolase